MLPSPRLLIHFFGMGDWLTLFSIFLHCGFLCYLRMGEVLWLVTHGVFHLYVGGGSTTIFR